MPPEGICQLCRMNTKQPTLQCEVCHNSAFHKSCFSLEKDIPHYECPRCLLRAIDPLTPVTQTIQEAYYNGSVISALSLTFQRPVMQTDEFLEIRCVRLKGDQYFRIGWPDAAAVMINGSKAAEFQPLHRCSPLKIRKDGPVLIERRFLKSGPNNIRVYQCYGQRDKRHFKIVSGQHYFIGLYVATNVKPLILSERLSAQRLDEKQSKKLLDFMASDDLEQTSLTITTKCVLSFKPLSLPARGSHCQHYQCFNLLEMLILMQRMEARLWRCPVCGSPCHRLLVDGFIQALAVKAGGRDIIIKKGGDIVFSDPQRGKSRQKSDARQKRGSSQKQKKKDLQQVIESQSEKSVILIQSDTESQKQKIKAKSRQAIAKKQQDRPKDLLKDELRRSEMKRLSDAQLYEQIQKYRMPYGQATPWMIEVMKRTGLRLNGYKMPKQTMQKRNVKDDDK